MKTVYTDQKISIYIKYKYIQQRRVKRASPKSPKKGKPNGNGKYLLIYSFFNFPELSEGLIPQMKAIYGPGKTDIEESMLRQPSKMTDFRDKTSSHLQQREKTHVVLR